MIDLAARGGQYAPSRTKESDMPLPPPKKSPGLAAKINQPTQAHKSAGGLKPTEEQAKILAAVFEGHQVLMIEAGAGTGKTSTLKMIGRALPGKGQYTAFNSNLVAESKEKFVGTNVDCNTTHSLAFREEGKRFSHRLGGNRIKAAQVARILGITSFVIGEGETKKTIAPAILASQVLGAIKKFCQSADKEILAEHFRYLDGIDVPEAEGHKGMSNNRRVREYLLPFARKAWADLSDPDGQLPFAHDHYVKIWQLGDNPRISADYILLDEAQDTAPVMLDILSRQKCPVILVGDSAQQIYEWRGAINALAAFPEAPRYLLSQSFRFGEAIAAVANAILDQLQEPTALRLKGLASILSVVAPLDNPTTILCRTNAVAIAKLLGAIAEGKKPFLIGGGADVSSFVEAAQELISGQPTGHPDLACFGTWKEVQEYIKTAEGEDLKLMVTIIDRFGAQVILDALRGMNKEEDADLVISTGHKSKGREWDYVQLASDFPTRDRCGDAELKLLYVMCTRAKLGLDLSCCPFFTGEDGMDIDTILAGIPTPAQAPVASPPPPPVGAFTWTKFDGQWLIRGPRGYVGQTVEVARKDGSTADLYLEEVVKNFNDATIYRAER